MPPTTVTVVTRSAGQEGVAAVVCLIERPNGRRELVSAPLLGCVERSAGTFLGAMFALGEVDPTEATVLRTSSPGVFHSLADAPWHPNRATSIGVIEARHDFLQAVRQFRSLRGELAPKNDPTVLHLSQAAEAEARAYAAERMAVCGFAPAISHAA